MSKTPPKEEHPMVSIMLNVVIPVVILTCLSKDKYLGPVWGLVAALILPIGYGIHTLVKEKRADFVSIIGIVSVLLTGVFGILKLPPQWIAVKEAAIPLIIGLAIVISLKTPYPLVKKILMSERLFNVELLHEKLREQGTETKFEKRLVGLTWGLASSMFLSSALNYTLAKIILKSEPGSEAFTAEIGKMTGLSYIVVMLPSMAVMICVLIALIKTLTHLTGLKMDDLLAEHLQEPKPVEAARSDADPAV
ncbi:MAG: VC0807 family protein [Kiritimatiellales bacterium]